MIEVQGLTRYYGDFAAVKDVSFRIADREIVGFLGLNGAGKSTTLRILGGLLLPSSGTVRIHGVDAVDAPDALRKRIGFLPEDPPLYKEMRVVEFLQWAGEIKGRSGAEVRSALPDVLRTCQIAHVANRPISELSHGYRKRVGIAQAIIHGPDLVILDEPISGLDPVQIVEMRQVVKGLKDRCTVLISSHILSEISQTCDRLLLLHRGSLVAEGTEEELASRLGGGRRLQIDVRGSVDVARAAIARVAGVRSLEVAWSEGDLHQVRITQDEDRAEQIVSALVAGGLGVRRVASAEAELEHIFLDLTRA